jgi:hypothetical protein
MIIDLIIFAGNPLFFFSTSQLEDGLFAVVHNVGVFVASQLLLLRARARHRVAG